MTDRDRLSSTRRALHAVAELLVAGPQFEASRDIRLRVVPGGFASMSAPDLRVEGTELVTARGAFPLQGTCRDVATAAGVEPRALRDVYQVGPEVGLDDPLEVDPDSAQEIATGFARGDAALQDFAPDTDRVLWPEHFDIAISLGEVNYGVSPGDSQIAEPYAYVGPWTPRRGDFWNVAFGAATTIRELGETAAIIAYFQAGAEHAEHDPIQEPGAGEPV